MTSGSLSAVYIHPIKSCRRIELDEVDLSATGLAGDREWQVVGADTSTLTQRQHRVLATVQPEPITGGLRISAPGRGSVEVERPQVNDQTVLALLGDHVAVGDAGDEAAGWFTDLVGEECRLVAMTPQTTRTIPLVRQQPITFVDAGPVLVTNTASLEDLRARAREPFGMERFRPNLVVDTAEPWVEDTWKSFDIGAAHLDLVLSWPRCTIPQIDQDTSERHKEPAVVLRAHRWCESVPHMPAGLRAVLEGNALFGIACAIGPEGAILRIGDTLTVHATTDPLIVPPS